MFQTPQNPMHLHQPQKNSTLVKSFIFNQQLLMSPIPLSIPSTPSQVDDEDLFADDEDIKSCSLVKAMKDPLVPANCTEPYEALQCLTHSFELRYGPIHPLFILGSLADVVAEATAAPPGSAAVSAPPPTFPLHY